MEGRFPIWLSTEVGASVKRGSKEGPKEPQRSSLELFFLTIAPPSLPNPTHGTSYLHPTLRQQTG
eukprot:1136722-Pelagomonas_calceolata.AAC.9